MIDGAQIGYLRPVVERDLQRLTAAFLDRDVFGSVSTAIDESDTVLFGFSFTTPDQNLLQQESFALQSLDEGDRYLAIARSAYQRVCDAPRATLVFLKHMKALRYPDSDRDKNPRAEEVGHTVLNIPNMEMVGERTYFVIDHERWRIMLIELRLSVGGP